MICIICKKPISRSYGSSELDGLYCKVCAEELGFYPFPPNIETRPKNLQALTPEQHIVKHIHCDISKEFLEEYKAEIEKATAKAIISAIKEKYGV